MGEEQPLDPLGQSTRLGEGVVPLCVSPLGDSVMATPYTRWFGAPALGNLSEARSAPLREKSMKLSQDDKLQMVMAISNKRDRCAEVPIFLGGVGFLGDRH